MNNVETAVLLAPLVHMGGSSGEVLRDGYVTAYHATCAAIGALIGCAPNARDYYPQGPDAFTKAAREHEARVQSLRVVRDELLQIAENVQDQIDAKESRKR